MTSRAGQLALQLQLPDRARFENFHAGPNTEAVLQLRAFAGGTGGGSFFLAGTAGSGRTHLLLAVSRRLRDAGGQSLYLSLADPAVSDPAILADLPPGLDMVIVDDIDAVAADRHWEERLFDLYNRLQDSGQRLLMAAAGRPDQCGFVLPDLVSRLHWGLVFGLRPLGDADRIAVLQLRAAQRGLAMAEEVARYLLRRYPRDLPSLCGLLDRLDTVSLQEQRRITVPFIRQALERETQGE